MPVCMYVCIYVFMYVNIMVTMTYVCTHAKRTFKKIANYKTSYAYIDNTGFLWSNLTKNYQVLYTYRHPLDVALSMHKREFEQFKVRRGLKLWYKHFRFHTFKSIVRSVLSWKSFLDNILYAHHIYFYLMWRYIKLHMQAFTSIHQK